MHSIKTTFDAVQGLDLAGKVFLVTGAYSGLGAATTQALLKAGATVILAGRSNSLQSKFASDVLSDKSLNTSETQLDASHTLDLGDLRSVRDFAHYVYEKYPRIDCLLNNAGVMYTPPGKTADGFETQMGVNVIGHFLLSKILADKTKRQVWLSSKGHTRLGAPRIDVEAITEVNDKDYNTQFRYQQSKLGDILLAKQFPVEYPHLKAASVHPGVVKTNLSRNIAFKDKLLFTLMNPLMVLNAQEPERGAATQVMVATMPEDQLIDGGYYADCRVSKEAESAKNMEDAKKLFDYCNRATEAFQQR
jgi:NAD(P)-dependent dehydrogenase (short-subunit alcohol dehydrogenase family)